MQRRHFLGKSAAGGAAALSGWAGLTAPASAAANTPGEPLRVSIIGHTGRGNYGHGLDTVWQRIPGTEIVGVADADPGGLEKELAKLKLAPERGFASYREMLAKVRPEFVSVAPRHVDQHRDMCLAAIETGVRGLYVEKPFLQTPAQADEVLAAAEEAGTAIAVAHRNRYHPALAVIDRFLEEGKLGRLLEIRARGKGDRRGGAEDLWVLGTHVLNLVNYFGGDPVDCSAVLLQDGRRVTAGDVVAESREGLGPLAGNELHARYRLSRGLTATFDSVAEDGTGGQGFGLMLVGSEGLINLQMDRDPVAHFLPGNPFRPDPAPKAWQPITSAGVDRPEDQPQRIAEVRNHVAAVRDLIAAAAEPGREPLCDAHEAALTAEMVCAAFESHRRNSEAVTFPLEQRENALALLE